MRKNLKALADKVTQLAERLNLIDNNSTQGEE